MPRQSVKQKNARLQWSDHDTFDFTTPNLNVTARQTDPYVQPAMSNDAAVVAQFASILNQTLKVFEERKVQKHDEDIQKGKRAKVRGEEKPEDASKGFIKGYETLEGMAGAAQLRTIMQDYYNKNWQLTPEEFQAGKDEIVKEFLEGRSDNYIDALIPGAIQAEQEIINAQYEAQHSIIRGNINSHIRQVADGMVDIMVDQDIDDPVRLRQGLSDIQALAKEQGLSRSEVSGYFIDVVGQRAIKEGKPELMNFVYEKDVSAGNLRLIDTEHHPKILQYIRQAESEASSRDIAAEKAAKQKREELKDSVTRTLAEKMYTLAPDDHQGWLELEQLLEDSSDPERNEFGIALDYKEIEHFRKNLNSLRLGGNFAQESDMRAYQNGYVKAKQGRLSAADLGVMETFLTREDFKELMKVQANTLSDRGAGKYPTEFTKRFDNIFNRNLKRVNQTNPIIGLADPSGADREEYFEYIKHILLEDFIATNKGKLPDTIQIRELALKAVEMSFEEFPPMFSPGGNLMRDNTKNSSTTTAQAKDDRMNRLKRMTDTKKDQPK